MCGIVGVLGKHEVAPVLVDALKRLEYRGYDSAGIATVYNGKLDRRRAVGKLIELSDLLVHDPLFGKSGIGHTRWATHGGPSVQNAHPHTIGRVSVVHNGIIENFQELRAEMQLCGYEATTQTDTETVAMLADHYLSKGQTPPDAVRNCLEKLKGAFGLCFLFEGEEDLMIAAREGSPLAIGYGDGEMYVGSDAIALAPMTDRVSYLEDGDLAVLTRSQVSIEDQEGKPANREIRTIRGGGNRFEKDGYTHFMEKEIYEQPSVISQTLDHYINRNDQVTLGITTLDFSSIERITLVACGTAFYACLTAKYWLEKLARIPVDVDVASEFRYREPPVAAKTMAIFVSQSGETADTLAALRYCQGKAAHIWSVTNVAESSIARESDVDLPIYAGVEIGVASTKAFTCQLTVLLSLAVKAAVDRDQIKDSKRKEILGAMRSLPSLINLALDRNEYLRLAANELVHASDILFLGRGLMFPLALEGALKLKEISYIHAEAYAAGELKHGPIALIDETVPVVVMAPQDSLFDKTLSNVQEVMARKGQILMIADKNGIKAAGQGLWKAIEMPPCHEILSPIIYAIPAQMLAYYTAVAKGTDVDQPRNLAKSVTVE
jgi:glucosamine--fructose-6-phosphate aminotransferase (isomerizing)